MTKDQLRIAVGLLILFCHFGILLVVLTSPLWVNDVRGVQGTFGVAQIIAPVFGGFATLIIRYFIKNAGKRAKRGKPVALPITILSFFLPIALSALILFFYLGVKLNRFDLDDDELRTIISSLATLFGIYTGYIIEDLFGAPIDRKAANSE